MLWRSDFNSAKLDDHISLIDIAWSKNPDHPDDVIRNWLRNRNTVEFLGVWERLNNPDFKPVEFDGFRIQAGLNSFTRAHPDTAAELPVAWKCTATHQTPSPLGGERAGVRGARLPSFLPLSARMRPFHAYAQAMD